MRQRHVSHLLVISVTGKTLVVTDGDPPNPFPLACLVCVE
jgi:hypothetical protein